MLPIYEFKNIQIEMTNACVHSCSNCTRFCGHHKSPFFMEWETFKNAVDSLENWPRMIGIMGGEPTLHPQFDRFVEYAFEQHPMFYNIGGGKKPFQSLSKYMVDSNAIKNVPLNRLRGLGLWSSVCNTYYTHYERIQDSFIFQCINDHTAVSRHQPWLMTRKEFGIPDEEWIPIRDNCWWQKSLNSPCITPKGAFFCEVAGAMDILFDGPGGWKVEKDWWKRGPDDYKDQLHWCEMCSGALINFDRDANEERDDVYPVMYEMLKKTGSPKLKKEGAIIVHEYNDKGLLEASPREEMYLYQEDDELRFTSANKSLFPKGFHGVIFHEAKGDLPSAVTTYAKENFTKTTVFSTEEITTEFNLIVVEAQNFFVELTKLIHKETGWITVVESTATSFVPDFKTRSSNIIYNPGTLHFFTPENMVLFHSNAKALKSIGFSALKNLQSFDELKKLWQSDKVALLEGDFEQDDCPDLDDWQREVRLKGVSSAVGLVSGLHDMVVRRRLTPKIEALLSQELPMETLFTALEDMDFADALDEPLCNKIKTVIHNTLAKEWKNSESMKKIKETAEKNDSFCCHYALALATSGAQQEKHLIDCVKSNKNKFHLGLEYLNNFQPEKKRESILTQCATLEGNEVVILGNRYVGKSLAMIFSALGITILAFGDNERIGTQFQGINTHTVEETVSKYPNATFVLSDAGVFGKEMKAICQSLKADISLSQLDEDALQELSLTTPFAQIPLSSKVQDLM